MRLLFGIQYFGNYYYYKMLLTQSHVVLNQYESHQKKSFNNRCLIAGANGPILLSIPLEKGRIQTTPLKDIRISNSENWQKKHWRSILSSYNASPWFSYFRDSLADLYLTRFDFLIDWDLRCLAWTIRHLKIDLDYELGNESISGGFDGETKRVQELKEQEANEPVRYQQVFENKAGFIPGLSILDLLFCTGPGNAMKLLKTGT